MYSVFVYVHLQLLKGYISAIHIDLKNIQYFTTNNNIVIKILLLIVPKDST